MTAPVPLNRKESCMVLAVSLLILAVFNVPWLPSQFFPHDLDSSWMMAMQYAFSHDFRWGQDLIWHYGPLGFLYGKNYYPDTYFWLIGLYTAFSAAFWAGSSAVWLQTRVNPAAPLAIAGLIAMLNDTLFFSFSFLLVMQYIWGKGRASHPVFWVILAATALTGVVKISYFLIGAFTVGAIELHRVIEYYTLYIKGRGEVAGENSEPVGGISRLRAMPGVISAAYIALLALFWGLAGQSYGDVWPYLRGNMEITYGFEAMTAAFRPQYYILLFIGLGAVWILAAGQVLLRRGRTRDALCFCLALLIQLFFVSKAEFLHDNDHHLMQALGWFFLVALLTKDFFWEERAKWATGGILLFTLASGALVLPGYLKESGRESKKIIDKLPLAMGKSSSPSASVPLGERIALLAESLSPERRFRQTVEQLEEHNPLRDKSGTVDIYNVYQQAGLAQKNLRYTPRPIYQSYHAYTPYLTRLNRDHLRSPDAPDYILFSLDVVSGRYPSIDDGLSWPDLLTRYDMEAIADGYIALHKSPTPRTFALTPHGEASVPFNEPLAVPESQGRPVWVEVDFRNTWVGSIVRSLYKLYPIEMRMELASGYTRTDRVTPDVMSAGFLLSPLVDNTLHFAMLNTPERAELLTRNRVSSIQFTCHECLGDSLRYFWDSAISVRFYALDIAPQSTSIEGWDEMKPYALLSSGMSAQGEKRPLPYRHIDFRTKKGKSFISLYGESKVTLPLTANQQHVSMNIGSFIALSSARSTPGPIAVRIEGRSDTGNVTLWETVIADSMAEDAAPPAKIELEIPPGAYDALIIASQPELPERDNWIYVKDVAITP